jgi:hypothetical protein
MENRMKTSLTLLASLAPFTLVNYAAADPTVEFTEFLGPFTGEQAALHPDNITPNRIAYYGTDLGFSYAHGGQIHFLFGDTWAVESYAPIEQSTGARFDDGFGTVDFDAWPDPGQIKPDNIPLIKLGQHPDSNEMSAIDPGHAMDLGKTPEAGFSNGNDEFGLFLLGKPQGCMNDADCVNGLTCDNGLGFIGPPYTQEEGFTAPCVDGEPNCMPDTMTDADGTAIEGSGFCSDHTSSIFADTTAGRTAAMAFKLRVGVRSTSNAKKYAHVHDWLTTKFLNTTGGNRRLLLWGRPGFVGVGAKGRTLGLYFAFVDMPAAPEFYWKINYYTGTVDGIPRFSPNEVDAKPADLDSSQPGLQSIEIYDVVDQMSIVWIDQLKKWVMFYGGGMGKLPTAVLTRCGILEAFTRSECTDVVTGNGAIRMRTADDPWGPWTPPQDVIAGGDPDVPGSGQYGIRGALHHATCTEPGCAPHSDTPYYNKDEYGFFYSANIIEQWIKPAGAGVDVIWNASTWDPYRVVLLRTRINP